MIDLSIQDEFDGTDCIGELRALIGSDELISVSSDGNVCVVIRDGVQMREPSWLTWNKMCS